MARAPIVCLLLAAATAALYAPTLGFDFVAYDDPAFLERNPLVRGGLSVEGLRGSLGAVVAANWHPLTLWSHMLDVELFGMEPAGHHATNVALHALNSLLLFAALRALTGRTGASGAVAALFALHPLNVETVAWVSQRKTLLAAACGWLALWAWGGYARRGGLARYLVVALLLALGLAAKPVLVTWPFLLLLLDAWPLGRLRSAREFVPRVVEKLPLFALAALACGVTLHVQRGSGALAPGGGASAPALANALLGYAGYLRRALWPSGLAVHYPHPYLVHSGGDPPGLPVVAACALLLAALTALAFLSRRGALRVGWLWFLGTLVPVIGLVQVGTQGLADRYAYLPLVGLFLAAVFGGTEALAALRRPPPRWLLAALAGVVLAALAGVTRGQLTHWRDSRALYERAVSLHPRDPVMLFNLANTVRRERGPAEALALYRRSLAVDPDGLEARVNLGIALSQLGRRDEAIEEYRRALRRAPEQPAVHFNLAAALRAGGDREGAIAHYRRALELAPESQRARRALSELMRGEPEPGGEEVRRRIR